MPPVRWCSTMMRIFACLHRFPGLTRVGTDKEWLTVLNSPPSVRSSPPVTWIHSDVIIVSHVSDRLLATSSSHTAPSLHPIRTLTLRHASRAPHRNHHRLAPAVSPTSFPSPPPPPPPFLLSPLSLPTPPRPPQKPSSPAAPTRHQVLHNQRRRQRTWPVSACECVNATAVRVILWVGRVACAKHT